MFIGRVLGNLSEQPEQHDKTFCFNEKEAHIMADNLKGIPVQLEHHKDMKVGNIRKAFCGKSGIWVIGELNENSLTTEFAKKAMESHNGSIPYYTGLSLSHSHCEYADGTTKKLPIEVSMCNDPRREDCRIISTKKRKYNKPIKPIFVLLLLFLLTLLLGLLFMVRKRKKEVNVNHFSGLSETFENDTNEGGSIINRSDSNENQIRNSLQNDSFQNNTVSDTKMNVTDSTNNNEDDNSR